VRPIGARYTRYTPCRANGKTNATRRYTWRYMPLHVAALHTRYTWPFIMHVRYTPVASPPNAPQILNARPEGSANRIPTLSLSMT